MFRRAVGIVVVLQPLLFSGCISQTFCNGSHETVTFRVEGHTRDPVYGTQEFVVGPCDCERALYSGQSILWERIIYTVFDETGNTLHSFGPAAPGLTLTYDGITLVSSISIPDLTTKSRVTFRNESSSAVHMKPARSVFREQTLLEPAGVREIITIRVGTEDFHVYPSDVDPNNPGEPLAACTAEIVDGLEIIWDGTDLTCGVAPPPPPPSTDVDIDLCNQDTQTNAVAVILVTADEEVLPEKNVIPGECRTVNVPTGAPVTFEAWDNEAVIILDECTLDDPSAGDQVVWDGFELTCVEVASAAAVLEPIPDPMPEEDPFEEFAFEAVRLGNDLTRSARRQIRRLFDEAIPF